MIGIFIIKLLYNYLLFVVFGIFIFLLFVYPFKVLSRFKNYNKKEEFETDDEYKEKISNTKLLYAFMLTKETYEHLKNEIKDLLKFVFWTLLIAALFTYYTIKNTI